MTSTSMFCKYFILDLFPDYVEWNASKINDLLSGHFLEYRLSVCTRR